MAGVVTKIEMTWDSVRKIIFNWTSGTGADAGKADGTTALAFCGQLKRAVFIPDGVAVPTDLYDVRILDSDGLDVLGGAGIDLSNAATVEAYEGSAVRPVNHMFAHTLLTLEVRNAGDTKKGKVVLYMR